MKNGKLGKLLRNLDLAIAMLALVALILITFVGVIMRYCLGSPLVWQEEAQLALIVWVVFLGGRYAFTTGSHPAIDMFVDMLPQKAQRVAEVLITLCAISILLYVAYQGGRYVLMMFDGNRVTSIAHLPYGILYLPLPVGCVLMSGQLAVNTWRGLRNGPQEGEA